MKANYGLRLWFGILGGMVTVFLAVAVFLSFERPPIVGVQRGFRGVGLDQIYNPRTVQARYDVNQVPEADPPQDPSGVLSGDPASGYQNVQVLKNLDSAEFLRLMAAITAWVSPEQGCNYCHNPENLAEDNLYTKRVARRMLQMVGHINEDWKTHVVGTGVTCYTCHRGNPVPSQIWFNAPNAAPQAGGMAESDVGKNRVSTAGALSSLPTDPFTPFLEQANNIRVNGTTALPSGNLQSIKQTDWTYSLMMHFSTALGVNCTYCHNSRAFSSWEQSMPQRTTAWYGIRMVRDLNNNYLDPLRTTYPAHRLGALGDAPKVNCNTCHQGVFKPLYGVSMLPGYPELSGNALALPAAPPATHASN